MQIITPKQIRGARVFLGLHQKQMAKQLEISTPTLAKWETDGATISENKVPIIKATFSKLGIEFIEDRGFLASSSKLKKYSGNPGLRTLFDSLYDELLQNKDTEVCVMGVDENQFFERLDFADLHTSRMNLLKPKMRVIKEPSELKNLQSYAEYKMLTPAYFQSTPVYIYGHKVVLISWDPLEAIMIENPAHYRSFKALFDHIWSNCPAETHI